MDQPDCNYENRSVTGDKKSDSRQGAVRSHHKLSSITRNAANHLLCNMGVSLVVDSVFIYRTRIVGLHDIPPLTYVFNGVVLLSQIISIGQKVKTP